MKDKKNRQARREEKLGELVGRIILSDLEWLGRIILKVIRLAWKNRVVQPDHAPSPVLPTGPYRVTREKQRGSLILWVPRGWNSLLIDDFTGGYGYSHLSVDAGEIDEPTGRPVMIESTIGQRVQHQFLDFYGPRCYVRIPLARAHVDIDAFCTCVEEKLGEQYDDLEALTWGAIDDPAKDVCSDLAAVCIPDWLRQNIAESRREHLLSRFSVSLHTKATEHGIKEFISPNGFAQYFRAPKGKEIRHPGQLVIPRPVQPSAIPGVPKNNLWKVAAVSAAALTITLLLLRELRSLRELRG